MINNTTVYLGKKGLCQFSFFNKKEKRVSEFRHSFSVWRQVYLCLEITSAVSMQVAEAAGKQRPKLLASVFAWKIAYVLASHCFFLFSTVASVQEKRIKAVPIDLLGVYLCQLPKHADVIPQPG